ncbi:hypothetical protein ACOZ4I_04650 [Haloarcula salina]|uniref:hypothetical protein n=1 Tax=Haloarcula salina TaxID=1429914 RepID=UPI003C6EC2A3
MTALQTLQNRTRLGAVLVLVVLVGAATYFEFIYYGPPTLYDVVLWLIVVPLLFATTVNGVQNHPLYQPLLYVGFIAIGFLQYLDGDWFLLAGLFVLAGVLGVISEAWNRFEVSRSG